MKNIFTLILLFFFNISNSFIDNNRIESYKYLLTEKDSIIQSEDYYPHNITDKDSFNYPLKVGVELNIIDIKDLTLKSNYFFAKFDFALYTEFDTIYISKLKDTVKLEAARYVRPDYDESDKMYFDFYLAELIEINDSLSVWQQPGYVENIFYHKWDLRNYPFDNQKLKINFITEKDTSVLRINENKYFSIAIFGKPNVGKSTFLNTLLGYNRSKTSPLAGTTSDYVIEFFKFQNKNVKIIDTAGIGKKSNIIDKSVNDYSVKKTFENIWLQI